MTKILLVEDNVTNCDMLLSKIQPLLGRETS